MIRFYVDADKKPCTISSEDGPFTLYEQARLIEVDRDIKAANLQLLVERVLMWEVQDSAFQVAPELRPHWRELMDLARSLKQ